MKIFNFEGMAIFGPGSEWLWVMLQFLALSLTGFAIYRQLRTQSSANALHALESQVSEWNSERMLRMRLALLMHIAEGKPRAALGLPPGLVPVGNFFDGIATLQGHGHLRMDDTWENWGDTAQYWWAVATPFLGPMRESRGGGWEQWEQLTVRFANIDRKVGRVIDYSAILAHDLLEEIPALVARLRLELMAKSGAIPTWPAPEGTAEAVAET